MWQFWSEDKHRRSIWIHTMHVTKQNCLNLSNVLLISCASLSTVSRTITFLFKVLFIFPLQYLFAIGLVPILSFRKSLPPILGCIHKEPTSKKLLRGWCIMCWIQYCHPLRCAVPNNLSIVHPLWRCFSRLQFAFASKGDFKLELFLLHLPFLWQSLLVFFPPLINMLKFSG